MGVASKLDLAALAASVRWLRAQGYRPVGPVVLDGTVAYRELDDDWTPPVGWTLQQAPGRARLVRRADGAAFAWVPGADSWKRFVYPPVAEVFRATRTDDGWTVAPPRSPEPPLALIGARACELRALEVLDRVFLDAEHPDPRYAARRRDMFVLAVDCVEPGGTCACVSAGGGPRAEAGFDVRVTELEPGGQLVGHAASDRGAELLAAVGAAPASDEELAAADARMVDAVGRMGRALPSGDLPTLLAAVADHPHWDDVAERCLACGNCTLVCPTCFCGTFSDHTGPGDGLGAGELVRRQEWASCFQADHSRLGPGYVRPSIRSRYRQWLTHKLETWPEQFGVAGCVGCGRCITWCPVGIDITAEAARLVASQEAFDAC